MIELHLPFPPSVNQAYRNVPGRGRVKTKTYKDWLTAAALSARAQHTNQRVGGPFDFELIAHKPDKRRRDIDNLIKVVLDFLKAEGFIDDDCLAQSVRAEWGGATPGVMVTIRGRGR